MKTSRRNFLKQSTFATLTAVIAGPQLLRNVVYADGEGGTSSYQVASGETTSADGWLTAKTRTIVKAPLAVDSRIVIGGKTGIGNVAAKDRGGMMIAFLDSEGKALKDEDGKAIADFMIFASDLKLHGGDIYADTYLQIIHLPDRMVSYVRPNMYFYKPDQRKTIAENWDKFPAASEHAFTLEFRRVGDTLQTWLDGNLMNEGAAPPAISSLQITLQPGAALQVATEKPALLSPASLPIAGHPWPEHLVDVQLKVDSKTVLPAAFSSVSNVAKGLAVGGLSLIPGLGTDDLQSFFWRRNAADNLPEQCMFSVPLDTYSHAYVLCAADEDPGMVNAFNLRVTRYGNSRGNAMADATVRVPAADAKDDANAQRVGTVSYGAANARKTAPLWLVKVPLKNGLIQDLLYDDTKKSNDTGTYKYLDVELFDPLYNEERADSFPPPMEPVRRGWTPSDPAYVGYDFYTLRPVPQTSGVCVLAMSLEKSPAAMTVRANTGYQVFYASDKPQFDVKITADKAGGYIVQWDFADVEGKIVSSNKKTAQLQAGSDQVVSIPVEQGNGWYAVSIRLLGAAQNELIDYRTSFVMLPPDMRKAGLESPFFGWWFGSNHGSDIKLDEVGPLLQRLGIRRVELPETMPESMTLPKYGFTNSTVRFAYTGGARALRDFRDGKITLTEAVAQHEADIQHFLELWPSVDRMLVFHESGDAGAPFPSEIYGETAKPLDDKSEKLWQNRIEYLTAMAQMVREKFPRMKMQYGNNGSSMNLVGELFRRKFPRKYIDTISSEDLGQTMAPERDALGSTQDGWYLRELARKMGYGDVPVTACTEWIGRMTEKLGLQKQAEWKVRDGILALAYGYDTISIAGINDAGDGYYYSIWANGGLNERYPTMAPKPAYAAIATLTQVLDQAKFGRFMPTGSTVLYCAEFQRGNQWVYAIWTPRGEREVKLDFGDNGKCRVVDLYGRESTFNSAFKASMAMNYIVSPSRMLSAAAGKSTFADDKINVPAKPLQTIPLESLDVINIVSDKGREKATSIRDMDKMVEGDFDIHEVEDPEMGKCIEIGLKPDRKIRLGETEYVNLGFAKPITTTAKNAGIWIKGNGSWGAVDIVKNHWGPWADNGNLHMNWPGDASLNFDGWNFITYPYYDWTHTTGVYATTIISGLRITFPRETLVGTERVPVENQKIRIKGIELF